NPRYSKNLFRKQQICKYFIEHLPKHDYFLQNFHYAFTDWLPFYWAGYGQTTRYTYILPDIGNMQAIEKNLGRSIQESLHCAKDKYRLEVKKAVPVDLFMEINAQAYSRQNKKVYHPEMLKKLIEASRLRNQGDIWGAYDAAGRLHAADFVVWQESCAYAIAGGNDIEMRYSGGHALSLLEAIREVSKVSASFDFEGSMIPGVEFFFREFGSKQMPYFVISKGKMNLLDRLKLKLSI
ncbi:MAG: GNAT family N-acetyltransferase, partial [Candidatus Symbiothrix sp.]|nr:GNAT family N-acetyltransferase [Candidatus Symbiothrix sp.]